MSEKRFVLCKKGDKEYIEDNCCVQLYGFDVLCEMLNEQQAIIEEQDRLVEKLRWVIDVKQKYIEKIEKENDDLDKIPPKIREVWLDD